MNLPNLDKLRILHYPNPVLKKMSREVDAIDDEVKALADRMFTLMHDAQGLGLAAAQVGVSVRVFVCNITGEDGEDRVFINPRVLETEGAEDREEGCLSVPGVNVTLRRATKVVLEVTDMDGQVVRTSGSDLEARVWQHEMDHLNGRLITENMSATDEIANRRAVKQLEAEYTPARRV